MTHSTPSSRSKLLGLLLGPIAAGICYLFLPHLPMETKATAAAALLMAIWWLTEAIPIAATALVPVALFPLAGIASIGEATAPYGHKLIFLFMGGFFISRAMQKWNLHQRIALHIICLMGTKPSRLVAGFMMASAFLSMWVSNTATVVMMLPIGLSVIESLNLKKSFAICLLLGMAYGASIGGVATLVGSPPNALFAAFMHQEFRIVFSFTNWLMIGFPITMLFLPLTWFVLTRLLYPIKTADLPDAKRIIEKKQRDLGPMNSGEKGVLVVFSITALLWIFRPILAPFFFWIGLSSFDDSSIAMLGALLLFILPAIGKGPQRLLDWKTAKTIPWDILVLFGGGLSLAASMSKNGVAQIIAEQMQSLGTVHPLFILIVLVTMVIFLTEIMSNTATTAIFLPIVGATAMGLGVHPMLFLLPATIAASFAFMMPVATPPNAIVFSSGHITIAQMARAGLVLNLLGIVVISVYCFLFLGG